jgi:hypothetical protein
VPVSDKNNINMEDIQFVVPSENDFPNFAGRNQPSIHHPKKPNKSLDWVKSHKILSIASTVMGLILLMLVIILITGQRISVFGYQLNPLYNEASECVDVDCISASDVKLVVPEVPAGGKPAAQTPVIDPADEPKSVVDACKDPANSSKLTPIFQYITQMEDDHIYTTSPNENQAGFLKDRVVGYVFKEQIPNTLPIYRSSQPQIGSHYYTTGTEDPKFYGYEDEGILGYGFGLATQGALPWYRLHIGDTISDYTHTVDENVKAQLIQNGYIDEGIVAFICPIS